MMQNELTLTERPVVRCKKNTQPLDDAKIANLLELLPSWRVDDKSGLHRLVRTFDFPSAAEATEFSTTIKAMADEADHHPLQQLEGNILTMQWWTHSIKGLHLNDFILAARCDEFYQRR